MQEAETLEDLDAMRVLHHPARNDVEQASTDSADVICAERFGRGFRLRAGNHSVNPRARRDHQA